jgi:RNA polymerase sigma factor (sigma-70 family)
LELALVMRAQAGDGAARTRVIEAGIPLIVTIARRYYSGHLEQDDLVQEGVIGLCEALDHFDAAREVGFATYATYWIRRQIFAALERNAHLIRLPGDVLYASRRVPPANDTHPPSGEKANSGRVSGLRLRAAAACMAEPLSLSAPATGDADSQVPELADTLTPQPESALLQSEEGEQLRRLMNTLSPTERLVVESRFGLQDDPVPLVDLAYRLRTTTEGVRYIQRRAIRKLRERWLDEEAGCPTRAA